MGGVPVEPIVKVLDGSLDGLRAASSNPDLLRAFIARLDPTMVMDAATATALHQALVNVPQLLDDITDDVDDLIDGDVVALIAFADHVGELVAELDAAARAFASADLGLQPPYDTVAYWADLLAQALMVLLADYLAAELPVLYGMLLAVGVVVELPGGGLQVDLGALGDLLDPGPLLREGSGWAQGALNAEWIIDRVYRTVDAVGLETRVVEPGPEIAELVGAEQPEEAAAIEVPFVSGLLPAGGAVELGLIGALVSTTTGRDPDALLLTNLSFGSLDTGTSIAPDWTLTMDGAVDATARIGALLSPDGLATPNNDVDTELIIAATGERPGNPYRPFGTATSTRLEVGRIVLTATLRSEGTEAEALLSAGLEDAVFVLTAGDSLLRTLFGADEVAVPFDLEARWSSVDGFTFGGSAGVSIQLPLSLTLGPVTVDGLEIGVGPIPDGLELFGRVDVGMELGPFEVVVGGPGLAGTIVPAPGGGGLFGDLDLGLVLVPPRSIGFTITAPLTSGGGLIYIDPASGRYGGSLALDLSGIGVSAVVVVDTALGGDPGWALFASIGATFVPGLPVGFGFSVTGVGGILALNRTIDVDELALGLRTGACDSVLFPDDPANDATAILNNLDQWFPVQGGSTIIGPVVEISWGSPARMVEAQLGVVLAVPDIVVVILGSFRITVPDPAAPVLNLNLDVLGAFDLTAGTVTVVGSLYDSTLLETIDLSGDMAFYLSLYGQPTFVLSVGGYHPGWDPPGDLPPSVLGLRRMRAEVELSEDIFVSYEFYTAVTSNSFHLGGRVELSAGVTVALTRYVASGYFEFNVLLVIRPFRILADVSAGVTVSAGGRELMGVDLRLELEGPDPWLASGIASFRFFGIEVDFRFEVGGSVAIAARVPADVLGPVVEALFSIESWSIIDDVLGWAGGVLTESTDIDGELWVRPDQLVQMRQTVAPLNVDISAFGEFEPEQTRIDVGEVTIGGAVVESNPVDDWFAPAQFHLLSDAAKLSQPSFALDQAGLQVGDDGVSVHDVARDVAQVPVDHETSVYPDPPGMVVTGAALDQLPRRRFGGRRAVSGATFSLAPTRYNVVDAVTGQSGGARAGSYEQAVDRAANLAGTRVAPVAASTSGGRG